MSDSARPERTFEENLAELEQIVRELEDGKTDLETAIKRYEMGVGLLKSCATLLQIAEQKIILLTGTDVEGKPTTEPFEHTSAVALEKSEARKRKPSPTSGNEEIPF